MVQLFLYTITEQTGGGREEKSGCHCHPSDLLWWLSVIWSGAPTDSLGGSFHIGPSRRFFERKFAWTWLFLSREMVM